MSSILTAVFKATIGLLVSKGRDKAAEKLKDGDPTDQRVRGLIVREIDDIKSKLDGLAKKDLLASTSFFKEGIELLYKVFEKVKMARRECSDVTAGTVSSEAVALAQGIRKLELTGLDESTSRALVNAKKRFERSREKATEAFANEALQLSDRVLAMQYRVMATILETVDNPEDALPACRVCIEELHSLSAVKEYFSTELKKDVRSRFSKAERRALIATVCHVNRVVYDVTLMVARRGEGCLLPCIEYGEQRVDPIRDSRVSEVLHKAGMEHCCITPWSFGQEGEEEHKLKNPSGVATNADGQFIIADDGDKTVKVFDSSGHFILKFSPYTDDDEKKLGHILDVATDEDSNIYVLVRLVKTGDRRSREVLVFNSTADQLCKFPVKHSWRLTVSKNKVLVASDREIHVYETDGGYVRSFGGEILKDAEDITAGPAGRVLVLDWGDDCIHVLTKNGQELSKFSILTKEAVYHRVAYHPGGEHVMVAGCDRETFRQLRVGIYTKDGECQRTVTRDQTVWNKVRSITVSMAGCIAVSFLDRDRNAKLTMF